MPRKPVWLIVPAAVFVAFAAAGATDESGAPVDEEIRALMQQRVELLSEVVEFQLALYREGTAVSLEQVSAVRTELILAKLELADSAAERIALREAQLEIAKNFEELAQAQRRAGDGLRIDLLRATINRMSAEIDLLREKQR